MKKLLVIAVAGLLMAACSDAPTAPSAPKVRASNRANADLECRSGYAIAFDENGNPYCAPVDGGTPMASPTTTTPTTTSSPQP